MLKIKGLKKIAEASKALNTAGAGHYLQVNYDIANDKVWYDEHVSLGGNSWVKYADDDVITCGYISCPHTVEELRDMVEDAVWRCKEGERLMAEQRAMMAS